MLATGIGLLAFFGGLVIGYRFRGFVDAATDVCEDPNRYPGGYTGW